MRRDVNISTFLDKRDVLAGLRVSSKKQLLSELAEKASDALELDARMIFDTLLQRERLGSTGVGHGIAIPHGKLHEIKTIFGLVAKLDKPIGFEAVDDAPVDIVFLLLAPETAGADHLKALARISRLARDADTLEKIRVETTSAGIYRILTQAEARDAA